MVRKNCGNCGKFVWRIPAKNNDTVFCSRKCYGIYQRNRVRLKCASCGDVFKVKAKRKKSAKFCSWECKKTGYYKKCKGCDEYFYTIPSKDYNYCSTDCKKKGEYRNCDYCNKEYYVHKYRLGKEETKYCSMECLHASRKTGKYFECKNCGKRFYRSKKHSERRANKYCSNKCNGEARTLYPNTMHLREKIMQKKARHDMKDWYICHLIEDQTGIKQNDIPQELIELKRLNIKRKRIIRNHNKKQ